MTQLLEQAIERLKAASEQQQDELARLLLDELDDERWAATTLAHADGLARLTARVLADDAKGLCEPLDPDTL